jgi:Na+-transporting NADH:ubiquinone oxidoreductase subunit F
MTEIALGTLLIVALIILLTLLVTGARAVLQPSTPVDIRVNEATTVGGATGQKLLNILNDGGIPVPSACAGAGTCGLCRVKTGAGAGAALPIEKARLSRRDLKEGMRLACQVVVRQALSVEVPEGILTAESWDCTVLSNAMLAPLIKELVLEVPLGHEFTFRAGAFVQVEAPPYQLDFSEIDVAEPHETTWATLGWRKLKATAGEPTARAYSVANTPADKGRIVLNIRLALPPPGAEDHVPPGIVSSYLFGLRPGDSVAVAGPFGDFHVLESEREMVFIGGGVGMAPLRAMIFDQLEQRTTTRRISFWYGGRSAADIFYKESFDALAEKHPNFSWSVALSEAAPEDNWSGPTGFIHDVAFSNYLERHPAPENCEYYLCGPPLMIQAVLAMLEDIGVEADSIFNDDFGI